MQINFVPYEKITIRNYVSFSNPEEFAAAVTFPFLRGSGGRVGPLLWASGVLFRHAPFAPSDVMASEYIKGHLPLDNIEFAPMEEYVGELRQGEFIITVQDVSTNYVLNALTNWIANNLLQKKAKPKRLRKNNSR